MPWLDGPGGNTGANHSRRQVSRNDRACANNAAVPNRHGPDDDRPEADQDIAPDDDLIVLASSLKIDRRAWVVEPMVSADERDVA